MIVNVIIYHTPEITWLIIFFRKMAAINASRNFINSCLRRNFSSKAVSISSNCNVFNQASSNLILANKLASTCMSMKIIGRPLSFSNTVHNQKSTEPDTGSKDHIEGLVKKNKVVVFMKGVPDQPMCGFSNAVVQILRMHGVNYDSHNVLDDDGLRAGIKVFSDWPTIPQIYFNGEFVGGCDIFLQMHQSGDLIEELKTIGIRSALLDEKK